MDGIIQAGSSIINSAIEFVYSFQPLVEPTVVLVPSFLDAHIQNLATSIGFDVETLEYTLGLFLCYPLGIIMACLPYGQVRHLFSFLLGAFLLQFTIGVQWIHQLITTVTTYLMFCIFPRSWNKLLVPAFSMIYITLGHLHRTYINYLGWDMDFTGPQMVITIKLYALAYNLYDGHVIANKMEQSRATKKCAPFAVEKLPSFLEYLGYCFCFSNVLTGPAYEYKIYERACNGSLLYKEENGKKVPRGPIPSCIWPTLQPFLTSLVCMVVFVVGNGYFPILDPADPQKGTPVVITEKMLSEPWYIRYLYAWMSLFIVRQKFYFAWKNAEGASNIWYAGFEGFGENGKVLGWDNASNMDIIKFETAPNVRTLSAEWNKKTANWLSRYVYIRTNGSLMATYGMSAFWHGFYPGYYLFFLSIPLLTMCERIGRKKLSPIYEVKLGKTVWYLVCMFSTSFVVAYIVMSFQLLAFEWAFTFWKSQYFFGHFICFLFYAVVSSFPTPKKKES